MKNVHWRSKDLPTMSNNGKFIRHPIPPSLSPINNGRLCSSGYLPCFYPSSIYSSLVSYIMIELKACVRLDLMKYRQPEGLNN